LTGTETVWAGATEIETGGPGLEVVEEVPAIPTPQLGRMTPEAMRTSMTTASRFFMGAVLR
jgi:hypothetical protein